MSNRRPHLRKTAAALTGAAALMALLTACNGTASGSVNSDGGTAAPAAGDATGSGANGGSGSTGGSGTTGGSGSAGGSGSGAAATSTGGTGSGSGSGTSGPAASGGSSAGGSAAGSVAACQAAQIGYSWADTGSGSGQKQAVVALTNKSGHTCTMYGFPGVDLVNSGRQWSLRRTDAAPQRVTLASGAAAHFTLTYLVAEQGDSTAFTPTTVVITAPNQRTSYDLPWHGGALVLQDGATHPGTYVGPVTR
ncbi:DUF4232 domain-containing protein [Streptomyces sp. NPDC007162]|uniref:DUF4232 domain-containing protein n=1 Tax=Streptomyces sp. NPDC007162 TaxID=3156917 RepID=UPI0033FCE4D3